MAIISALRRDISEKQFKARLGYIAKLCLRNKLAAEMAQWLTALPTLAEESRFDSQHPRGSAYHL